MSDFQLTITALLLAVMSTSGCSLHSQRALQSTSRKYSSCPQFYTAHAAAINGSNIITRPSSVLDIVENSYKMLCSDYLSGVELDESFFKKVSGGMRVTWISNEQNYIYVSVDEFGEIIPDYRVGNNIFPGVQYKFIRKATPDGTYFSKISLAFINPPESLSFKNIESILGKSWEYDRNTAVPHGRTETAPEHSDRYANANIIYKNRTDSLVKTITARFSSTGKLTNIEFEEHRS